MIVTFLFQLLEKAEYDWLLLKVSFQQPGVCLFVSLIMNFSITEVGLLPLSNGDTK